VAPLDRWLPWRGWPEPGGSGWAAVGAGHRSCGPAVYASCDAAAPVTPASAAAADPGGPPGQPVLS